MNDTQMRVLTDAEFDLVSGGAPPRTMNNAPSLVELTANPSGQTTQVITLSDPGKLLNFSRATCQLDQHNESRSAIIKSDMGRQPLPRFSY
jgi:hypothetical protein